MVSSVEHTLYKRIGYVPSRSCHRAWTMGGEDVGVDFNLQELDWKTLKSETKQTDLVHC